MTEAVFDRLAALLGEPDRQAPQGSWDAAEEFLGVRLPSGYKTFVDRWGPGTLDGFLTVLGPVDGTADEARELWGLWYGWQPGQQRNHDFDPFPYHPEPGGLIGWGADHFGGAWFFLAQGPDPDRWPIAVVSDTGQWYATRGAFPAFLLRCLEREDYPLFLDLSWPRPQPHYLPYRAG
ncbi:hypothetical protein ACFV4P_26780 [Kitasatospora sp. NPDC059795]|uniref:hypothetical protein n=1 Tax=Kitasatospora sp. NPDC059795 TaxID=3346949 RepID=UPI00364D9A22